MVSASEVLKFTRGRHYSPMTAEELAKKLGVKPLELPEFHDLLRDLEYAGEIVEVKNKRFADPERVDLVVGTLTCHPRGFAFLRPVRERDGEDLYISAENQSSAMHGDLVVVRAARGGRQRAGRVERGARGGRGSRATAGKPTREGAEVKVVSVLKHARSEIVGTLRREGRILYVAPDDPRLFRDVLVAEEDARGAQHNDKVAVRITVWPSRHMNPSGEVAKIFGPRGELEAERLSVVHEFGLRMEFPAETLAAADRLPATVRDRDLADRRDLTGEMIFTIDPEDARDFDDAVCLTATRGGWELGVHIADVSHYIKPGDPIDREALARGTSVYLPGQVLPMLPEKLSNGLCSLRPDEVRLTKTALIRLDARGNVTETDVFPSFIRSIRRFNYKEVQAVIEGGALPQSERALQEKLHETSRVAELMRARRRDRGMLEMDIPEAHVVTDEEGRTRGVELRRADESHRLIEQFMLAANEAVANYLLRHHLPYLCRAHDEPDPEAIEEFRQTMRALGHSFPSPGTRQQMQRFLERVAGKPDAHLVSYLLLRSMKMAQYSAADLPHYAIAADHYLHFTSPIRRYPDLLAHRILEEHWAGRLRDPARKAWYDENLPVWTAHSTQTERNAAGAERAITQRRLLDFVAARKTPMTAVITGVENYGLKIQLLDYLLDGVVRFSALSDAFYKVNKARGSAMAQGAREYKVGQKLQVRVLRYNELKRQIEFEPVK